MNTAMSRPLTRNASCPGVRDVAHGGDPPSARPTPAASVTAAGSANATNDLPAPLIQAGKASNGRNTKLLPHVVTASNAWTGSKSPPGRARPCD